MMNFNEFGPASETPLVIVHGLFGSARNWGVIAKRLSDNRRVYTVDLRNHGQSFHDPSHTQFDLANDIREFLDHLGVPVDLLGHSMGGKASMVAALQDCPIRRLIVADIAPTTYSHTQAHNVEIMRNLDLSQITTRGDADTLLAEKIDDPMLRSFFLQSLNVAEKTWRLNLPVLADQMPHIMSFPKISGQATMPALFLTGANSDYVEPQHRPQILELFPKAQFVKIKDAGHWLHAEKPREFEATVRAFLGG